MNLLDKILVNKRKVVSELAGRIPVKMLEKYDLFSREVVPLSASVVNPDRTGIIAEFKRKSPSAGEINPQARVEEITTGYSCMGASGLSILTDKMFFGGSSDDLSVARQMNSIPILRKDFIIDEYQVIESKAIGADAILLIATVLTKVQIKKLAALACSVGLQTVLEIRNEEEIKKTIGQIDIIGVNNRDLRTFKVNTDVSFRLADKIPAGFVKISESGISSPEILIKLRGAGYQGFLIGGKFMRDGNPVDAFARFIKLLIGDNAEN